MVGSLVPHLNQLFLPDIFINDNKHLFINNKQLITK